MTRPGMTVYIGLLRAVNVGGSGKITMIALAALLSRMGLGDVHTVLRSGNVVFRSDVAEVTPLEVAIERALSEQLGLRTDVFVRTLPEWRSILRQNPFPLEAKTDPAHLVVTLLKRAPEPSEWRVLERSIPGRERIQGAGRHAYIVYPDGIGTSKLTAAVIERQLSTRSTSRNWNTVQKLDQLASS